MRRCPLPATAVAAACLALSAAAAHPAAGPALTAAAAHAAHPAPPGTPAADPWAAAHPLPTLVRLPAHGAAAQGRYHLSRPGRPGLAAPTHRGAGHEQRVRLLADGRSDVTVLVSPLAVTPVPHPPAPATLPPDVARYLSPVHAQDTAIARLAARLAAGAAYQHEVSERILTWTWSGVEHSSHPDHDESPEATLAAGAASCVGRSRLAVALLRAAGLPARTVHGLLVPETAPVGATLGSAEFVLHRFVETHVDGVGWLPSDPGASLHVVSPRLLVLAVGDDPYDPETQRDLRVRIARRPDALGALGPVPRTGGGTGRPTPVPDGDVLVARSIAPHPPDGDPGRRPPAAVRPRSSPPGAAEAP